jgi:hypothetical protein
MIRINVVRVVNYPDPSTTGECGLIICSPASGSFFGVGLTPVICTATDTNGRETSCTFTITVNDTQPPTITCPGDITTDKDPAKDGKEVTFIVTATDNCSVATLEANPPSGWLFPVGTTTVSGTATDPSKNAAVCVFTVTVVNTPRPVVPTFTDSGMVIMSVLFLGIAIFFLKRRKTI